MLWMLMLRMLGMLGMLRMLRNLRVRRALVYDGVYLVRHGRQHGHHGRWNHISLWHGPLVHMVNGVVLRKWQVWHQRRSRHLLRNHVVVCWVHGLNGVGAR